MADEARPLSSVEYNELGIALFERLSDFTGFPEDIRLKYHAPDEIGDIGLYATAGGKYLSEDVVGGFTAQLPFAIAYKCAPTANYQYMEIDEMMNDIASFMENKPFPLLTDGREVNKITMNSVNYIARSEQDGAMVYVRSGTIIYEK